MADQCIVCLEDLDVVPDLYDLSGAEAGPSTTILPSNLNNQQSEQQIALIQPCSHVLHDECLREWAQKANSCPICRHAFNVVTVLDKVGGTVLSEYQVEDKKQVADFDPNAWTEDNAEEEEPAQPCPICGRSDEEDILLLCDGCDAPYHTHCVDLDRVPNGQWFCMECAEDGAYAGIGATRAQRTGRTQPRTQASRRRIRQRLRTDQWVGIWGMLGNRVHEAVGLDLDFSDDEQQHMVAYRTHQRRTSEEIRESNRWQQRLAIASRQGAREIFRNSAPIPIPRERRRQTPELTPEESLAWGALEKAKEIDDGASTPRPRKRKSRSATASPAEPAESKEPERKLKRPRTRRVLGNPGPSSASPVIVNPRSLSSNHRPTNLIRPYTDTAGEPSFLSSLLREVETATPDEDLPRPDFSPTSTIPGPIRATSPSLGYSSPGASPSPTTSTYHTPRAMSATPPPINNMNRPGSPVPLTSRVEPKYTTHSSPAEIAAPTIQEPSVLELRQPRPQRPAQVPLPRSNDTSPTRANMSIEAKEGINKMVKSALAPHWKSAEITKEQYAEINRDVSRKLYDLATDGNTLTGDEKWEKIATVQVAIAVKALMT